MALEQLRINNLRNISEGLLVPAPGINIINGPNGAGKTSLLEGIYLLGRGRSFRGKQIAALIQKDKEVLELYGIALNRGKRTRIGLRKSREGTEVRLNGDRISKLSLLAREFPVHLITPRSHEILEGSADYRRRFMEWGVFHVEPRYQFFSIRYHRAVAQRNAALKKTGDTVDHWTPELVESGEFINRIRVKYLESLELMFQSESQRLLPDEKIRITWKRGWSETNDFREILEKNRERDRRQGYTTAGPHRADLVVTVGEQPACQRLSRGQQKLVVVALIIAQARIQKERVGLEPIILVDDLASELDSENRVRIMERLIETDLQLFVTTTGIKLLPDYPLGKLFHVEHGVISEEGV